MYVFHVSVFCQCIYTHLVFQDTPILERQQTLEKAELKCKLTNVLKQQKLQMSRIPTEVKTRERNKKIKMLKKMQ